MASSTANVKKMTLKSSDGEEIVVEKDVALQSILIQTMFDSECSSADVIPLSEIDGKTLALIVEYCKKHANPSSKEEELMDFDKEYVKPIELHSLLSLVSAANFLEIKGLLDLICQQIADQIKYKPHEEVREIFNVENDYTPAEEAEVRAEYAWAFSGFPSLNNE